MRAFTLSIVLLGLLVGRANAQCTAFSNFLSVANGDTVTFTDFSTGEDASTKFLWTFGDGDSSSQQNPVHFYASAGTYGICLTINDTDIAGCTSTACDTITICPVVPNFTYSDSGLFSVKFTDLSSGEDANTTYYWTFGDGASSAEQNPTHTYAAIDSYYVCLNVYDNTAVCNAYICAIVNLPCPLAAGFTFSNINFDTVAFQDTSTGEDSNTVYYWDFGDGIYSASKNPIHVFTSAGSYSVCFTATDTAAGCSSQQCNTVNIVCPLTANFVDTATSLYSYLFTDLSTGESASTTYSWDFGDSTNSNLKNPSHTFDSAGIYQVCLTISDSLTNCSNQFCNPVFILCPLSAGFNFAVDSTGYVYSFFNNSSGTDSSTSYLWDFGDGTQSDSVNPTHTFATTGTFTICLTISGDGGCTNQTCQTLTICPVNTFFSDSEISIFTFAFTDLSSGEDSTATYLWDFGDSTTSTQRNPTHTFATQNLYNVCLTVTDTDAGCSTQYCQPVEIMCPALPFYTYTVDTSGYTYYFTDASTGEDTSAIYFWDFGDSTTSSIKNPTHTFGHVGVYNVCFTVTDTDLHCGNTFCFTISICPITPNFTYVESGLYNFNFIDSSKGEDSSDTYFWAFGDGGYSYSKNPSYSYSSLGSFQVCLTITSNIYGCANEYCSEVQVSCPVSAKFGYSNSSLYNYSFKDSSTGEAGNSTYLWDFGDGRTSTTRNPGHTFDSTGNYNVCLTVTNPSDTCSNTYCTTISVCPVSVKFGYSIVGIATVAFTDSSTGEDSTSTFYWDFGNGSNSTAQSPTYNYHLPGSYEVCLTVSNADLGCSQQSCMSIFVPCPDSASFTYRDSGFTFYFTDVSFGEDASVSYLWDFGDGSSSTQRNPVHIYTSVNDTTNVCLTIQDVDIACTSSFCTTIDIPCPDTAIFTYTYTGSEFQFSDSSIGEIGGTTYHWVFGDGDTSNLQNPRHLFFSSATDTFDVCFTIFNPRYSCTNTGCQRIAIQCANSALFLDVVDSAAVVSFSDASNGEDSTAVYIWSFGDGDSSNLQNPTHVYPGPGQYYVCFTEYNADDICPSQSCDSVTITVNGIASLNAPNANARLYPNPASGMVNVEVNGAAPQQIKIFNELGQQQMQLIPTQKTLIPLDVHALVAGIYIVQVSTDHGIANLRLVLTN